MPTLVSNQRAVSFPTRLRNSPSPWGEGWGEGDRDVLSVIRPRRGMADGKWQRPELFRFEQLVHTDELIPFGREVIQQFPEAGVELVAAIRSGANVEQQQETV